MLENPDLQVEEEGNEIQTVYGDLITFVMVLFILLFVLAYNQEGDESFVKEMQLKFGAPKVEQQDVLTTEDLFVSKIANFIKEEELQDEMKVLVDEQKISLVLKPPVLYASGKANLTSEGLKVVNEIAAILKDVENPIVVEGHTDNVPIKSGPYKTNWELSFFRAFSVVKFLIDKHGFSPERLSALGYGEFRPLVENDTRENRALNRRIVVNIIRVTQVK